MEKIISLTASSPEIQYLCNKDKRLAKIIKLIGPLSYKLHDAPYEFLIHEIIEQMLSVKAGNKIFSRLVDLCNGCITPEKINQLNNEQTKSIGTANSKVSYIRCITNTVLD